MVVEVKKNPKGFYKNIYQSAWNQYEFRSRSRDRVEKKIEILLAISGIIAAFLLTRLSNLNNSVLVSIVLLGLIFLISLYEFIIPRTDKKFWFPSVEKPQMDGYKTNNDLDGFYKQIVEECYKLEGYVNDFVSGRNKIIRLLTFMLLFAAYIPIAYEIYTNQVFFFSGSLVGFAAILILFYKASEEKGD